MHTTPAGNVGRCFRIIKNATTCRCRCHSLSYEDFGPTASHCLWRNNIDVADAPPRAPERSARHHQHVLFAQACPRPARRGRDLLVWRGVRPHRKHGRVLVGGTVALGRGRQVGRSWAGSQVLGRKASSTGQPRRLNRSNAFSDKGKVLGCSPQLIASKNEFPLHFSRPLRSFLRPPSPPRACSGFVSSSSSSPRHRGLRWPVGAADPSATCRKSLVPASVLIIKLPLAVQSLLRWHDEFAAIAMSGARYHGARRPPSC